METIVFVNDIERPFRKGRVDEISKALIENLLNELNKEETIREYAIKEEKRRLHPDLAHPTGITKFRKLAWCGKLDLDYNPPGQMSDYALIYAFAELRYWRFIEYLEKYKKATYESFIKYEKRKYKIKK